MKKPFTPECDKMLEVAPFSQKIGEFLDWLEMEKDIVFAQYMKRSCGDACHDSSCPKEGSHECHALCETGEPLVPAIMSTTKLLAEFFEIDLNRVEEEKRRLLEEQRALNASVDQRSPRPHKK